MCVICGCGQASGHPGSGHAADHAPAAAAASGLVDATASVPGLSPQRAVQLEADVLGANQHIADHNRAHFAAHGVAAFNLLSSPGAGKTTLLCATVAALRQRRPDLPLAVIEGDQQTQLDADRIRATGTPAIQVNTGRGCHLDAQMVAQAFARLPLHAGPHQHHDHDHDHDHGTQPQAHVDGRSLLFIENVGNLVCPALWDLGEAAKVVILSVTEGEDKPSKYPDMFAAADLLLINKIDLLPYVDFDVGRCIELARRVRPDIQVLQLSARNGEGLEAWVDWLLQPRARAPVQLSVVQA